MDSIFNILNSSNNTLFAFENGGLAQLARALAWHARGHRFDSDILHDGRCTSVHRFVIWLHSSRDRTRVSGTLDLGSSPSGATSCALKRIHQNADNTRVCVFVWGDFDPIEEKVATLPRNSVFSS